MHPLPPEVKQLIEPTLDGESIDLTVESDLADDGQLGKQWLIWTSKRLMVVGETDGEPVVERQIALSEVVDARAEPMIGSGCLFVNVNGELVPLVRYTNSLAKEFGHVARRLQASAKGENAPATTDEDRTRRCPNCAFPLETGSSICPNCIDRTKAVGRLLAYVAPYKWLTIVAAILTLANQCLLLLPPYLTKVLVDGVLGKADKLRDGAGNVPTSLVPPLIVTLSYIVIALVGSKILGTALGIVQSRISARLGSRIVHDIRMQLYSALERLTVGFFDKRQTGAVISRISQDTSSLQDFLAGDVQMMMSNLLILILVLVILFQQNWQLAALTIIPVPFAAIAATVVFTRLRWVFRRVWHRWSKLHSVMSDSLQGLRVVKAFAQEDREIARFERRSKDLYVASMQAEQTWATLLPILWFVLTAGQFIVWYAGGIMVIRGHGGANPHDVSIGTLVMFIGYVGMLYHPLQMVTRMWDWVGRCLAASERVFEIIDSPREEEDVEHKTRLPDMSGAVSFKHVTFGYDKNYPVLHDINIDVKPGEMIGLVGHSGAGKSTVINLLARFYLAQEGSIEIDGADIREINLEDLRRQIGTVPQESYLFSGTVSDNIAYSKKDATPEEIVRAAKAANAHDFIVNLPDGYETQVGERGHSLSGGERQRIAIARAILHDPKILILDEATSSVDSGTEKQIQDALNRLVKNRTTFAIAHRLSTLRNADRLLVLEKGKQVELGTHDELVALGGVYSKLIDAQNEMSKLIALGG